MNNQTKIYMCAGIVVLLIAGMSLLKQLYGGEEGKSSNNLYPVSSFAHAHGLSVDIEDPNKVYIATHHGLFVLINDSQLYQIGKNKDDYMGFSVHPADPDVFFTSGHPARGGNLGFQKSEDKGATWEKLSDGVGGPVDFHSMAVHPANPSIILGWYERKLHISRDQGKNWEALDVALPDVIGFSGDPNNENVIYAVTLRGISVSADMGKTWNSLQALDGQLVTSLTMHPSDSQKMIIASQKMGISASQDSGITWQKLSGDMDGKIIYYLAISVSNPQILYSLTSENEIYKSRDGGKTWYKIY
jgi:photosystem II stability/assembly factor-like uncharacterized protein